MIQKDVIYFGTKQVLACDAQCDKAWGINNRPREQLSDQVDDYAYLADGELGEAPVDPGTYEGGYAKPQVPEERLNKWCCRECERSIMRPPGEPLTLPDFTQRIYNIPARHCTPPVSPKPEDAP